MKLVIEIPEKTYHMIKDNIYDYGDMNVIIQKGKPLDTVLNPIIKDVIKELKNILYGGIKNEMYKRL